MVIKCRDTDSPKIIDNPSSRLENTWAHMNTLKADRICQTSLKESPPNATRLEKGTLPRMHTAATQGKHKRITGIPQELTQFGFIICLGQGSLFIKMSYPSSLVYIKWIPTFFWYLVWLTDHILYNLLVFHFIRNIAGLSSYKPHISVFCRPSRKRRVHSRGMFEGSWKTNHTISHLEVFYDVWWYRLDLYQAFGRQSRLQQYCNHDRIMRDSALMNVRTFYVATCCDSQLPYFIDLFCSIWHMVQCI